MAIDMHITEIKGKKQGKIEGSVTTKGREKQIRIVNYQFHAESPRDHVSRQTTGRRQYTPFSITKIVDRTSPMLFSAFVNNETLETIKLEVIRSTDSAGKHDQTVWEFANAQICQITSGIDVGLTDSEATNATSNSESIEFVFEKITITHTNGGIVGTDNWDAPIA